MVVSRRLVQVGRVCQVNYGNDAGKLVVIVNIADASRVLVDGPTTGMKRQLYNLARLNLTDIVVEDVVRDMRPGRLAKVIEQADIQAQFNQTSWAKKQANRAARANLSDFERYQVLNSRRTVSKAVRTQFNKLKKN